MHIFFKRGLVKNENIYFTGKASSVFNTTLFILNNIRYIHYAKTSLTRPFVLSKSYDCETLQFFYLPYIVKNDIWISHPNDT